MKQYREITGEAVIEKVRQIAADRPEFVYEAPVHDADGDAVCVYWEDGPSCIFGHALYELGVASEDLRECDQASWGGASVGIVRVVSDLGLDAFSDEVHWMATVQSSQDSGLSWGASVESADNK